MKQRICLDCQAEIERLNDIIRRAAWLEQAPEEDSPYIDFESYARATEEAEVLRARAEKAESERDQLKQLHRHALDCVDQVFQQCREIPNPALPDFCELGEDKFQAVIRLARSYRAERTRAEKAEAEFSARLETIKRDRREWMARAEKAEAERADVMRHVEKMMLRVEAAEARAARYLAAMTALVETDGTDAEWLAPLAAIRAIVEEERK